MNTADMQATQAQSLAPPPPAPHGPRSPAQLSLPSRTPSPATPSHRHSRTNSLRSIEGGIQNGLDNLHLNKITMLESDDEIRTPIKPSAKALGKRKIVDSESTDRELILQMFYLSRLNNAHLTLGPFDPDDIFYEHKDEPSYPMEDRLDLDPDEDVNGRWQQPVRFVYDAAAERTQQRIREGQSVGLVNGVH